VGDSGFLTMKWSRTGTSFKTFGLEPDSFVNPTPNSEERSVFSRLSRELGTNGTCGGVRLGTISDPWSSTNHLSPLTLPSGQLQAKHSCPIRSTHAAAAYLRKMKPRIRQVSPMS